MLPEHGTRLCQKSICGALHFSDCSNAKATAIHGDAKRRTCQAQGAGVNAFEQGGFDLRGGREQQLLTLCPGGHATSWAPKCRQRRRLGLRFDCVAREAYISSVHAVSR